MKARQENASQRHTGADRRVRFRQHGATLVVTLILLIGVSLIGISTAHIAMMGEKSARNERDRHIAFQSAEAALLDAEMDISRSPDASRTRSWVFASAGPDAFVEGCGAGERNISLGLCRNGDARAPSWLTVDFLDDSTNTMKTVPYGMFTGQPFVTGKGMAPASPPRYIVERIPYGGVGENAALGERSHLYRITAVGFGVRDSTRVMLQTFFRKE